MQMQQQLAQVSRHVIGLNYTERNAQADEERELERDTKRVRVNK